MNGSVLDRVQELFARQGTLAIDREQDPVEYELRVATVTVLFEAALSDEEFHELEREVILNGIERDFGVSAEEAGLLLKSVEGSSSNISTFGNCLELIRERYDSKQCKRICDLVRKVIEADKEVNEFEHAVFDFIEEKLGLQD